MDPSNASNPEALSPARGAERATRDPSPAAAHVVRRMIDAIERRRAYRAVLEIGLVAIAFLLYFIVRGLVVDRADEALTNANAIMDLERSLGIFWEPRLQELIIDHRVAVQVMNIVYFWLDFPLIVGVGLWMYFRHRHAYTVTRDALLSSGAISLCCTTCIR